MSDGGGWFGAAIIAAIIALILLFVWWLGPGGNYWLLGALFCGAAAIGMAGAGFMINDTPDHHKAAAEAPADDVPADGTKTGSGWMGNARSAVRNWGNRMGQQWKAARNTAGLHYEGWRNRNNPEY
jgi:hypothetical protein